MTGVHGVGERVEQLLAALRSRDGDPAGGAAEGAAAELVRLLVGLYGDGLAHIVATLADHDEAGDAIMTALTEDPLVDSLLILHDLHPLDLDARVQRALDRVRPYLGSHAGGIRYLGVTDGVARLELEGNCQGCPSSTVTVRMLIESAVLDAGPDVTEVVVAGVAPPPQPVVVQIGRRPVTDGQPPPGPDTGPRRAPGSGQQPAPDAPASVRWTTLPDLGPPSSRPVTASVEGTAVLVCSVRGTAYAYRDACTACGSSLGNGLLERERLTCPHCAARYDVRLAGRGIDDPASHLDPLPLLADGLGVRVALPQEARA